MVISRYAEFNNDNGLTVYVCTYLTMYCVYHYLCTLCDIKAAIMGLQGKRLEIPINCKGLIPFKSTPLPHRNIKSSQTLAIFKIKLISGGPYCQIYTEIIRRIIPYDIAG